ncbi:uncharacterized protein F4822DRAFT_356981 [Hypoxylon trugodes]|uniref:uncharacterized protein n=1 Tax=Hypoxylon trugodes TaxID=326681 RepID=UPI00219348CC|nr:uncharacterized protein F4822DRAFT_356981 [Hypoxylon trugodes]KAI1385893.1 hypothetical protein F4822DRAFT_356981 [Hypoxylon trugodes]
MSRLFSLATIVVTWLLIVGARGQGGSQNSNKIMYPTKGLSFNYLDTVIVAYESNISAPLLKTWCRSTEGKIQQKRLDYPAGINAVAPVELNFTMGTSMVMCWFNLHHEGASDGVNSEGFQFNSTKAEQKTFSMGSATSPTSISPASTQSGDPTVEPTNKATSTPSQDSSASTSSSRGLSPGASAGIGVGVGLVVIGIGATAAALVFRRRRNRLDGSGDFVSSNSLYHPPATGAPNMTGSPSSHYLGSSYYTQTPHSNMPSEPSRDGGLNAESAFIPYQASIEDNGQKYRGTPVGSRHEMEGTAAPVHEMP